MKKLAQILILFVFFSLISSSEVKAQQIFSDNFNSLSNWTKNSSVGLETFLCGAISGPTCAKLASTQDVPSEGVIVGDGWIRKSFSVIIGATYRAQVLAGVYVDGVSPDGQIKILMTDGLTFDSNWCTQNTCPAVGSNFSTPLYLDFTPATNTLTVVLEGYQGGCIGNDPNQGCHDTGVDDFTLAKTADPTPSPTPVGTNNASSCTSISINNNNPVTAGQSYSATVNMRNDGNTTWSSGSGYNLGSQEPQDLTTWGTSSGTDSGKGTRPNRVPSPNTGPGGTANFTFNVTAPNTAGTYRFSYEMVQDGSAGWFGARCSPNVNVSAPTSNPTLNVICTGTVSGQSATWVADMTGGTLPFTSYLWSGTDSLTGSSSSITKTYSTAGTKSATVTVTDSSSPVQTITSPSCSVTISAPTVSLSANPTSGVTPLNPTLTWVITGTPISCSVSNSGLATMSGTWDGILSAGEITNGTHTKNTISLTNTSASNQTRTFNISCNGATDPAPVTVTVQPAGATPLPDLTAYLNSVSDTTAGTSLSFSGTVTNSGSAPAGGFYGRFCMDNASCLTSTTGRIGSDHSFSSLNTSVSSSQSSSSWTAVLGSHTVYFCADVNTEVTEASKSNNCSSRSFTVSSAGTPTPTPTPTSGSATAPWVQTIGGDVHSNSR